jgi:co-chaperonin GroES (HSP10)
MIVPLKKMVLIEPYKAAKETASGIARVNDSNGTGAPCKGKIIDVGSDVKDFTKEQEVYFRRYSTDELKFVTPKGEVSYMLVDQEDILGIEV